MTTTLDMNALTNALTTMVSVIQAGNGRAMQATAWVTDALGIIEVVMWGASVLLGSEALAGFVKKFLGLQFWLWIIRQFQQLAKVFLKSLVAGAFSAGGTSGGLSTLLDPSKIAGSGLDATLPLAKHIDNLGKWDFGDKVVLGLVLTVVMACFILMAANIAWAVIEFYIFLNLSSLVIPFALVPSTRFIADKGINAVLACTLKLTVYAFVVALIGPVLAGIDFHATFGAKDSMNWNDIWSLLAITFFCLGLCWKAPHLAAGLIHGSPTLSASAALAAAATGAVWLGARAVQGVGSAVFWGADKLSDWGDRNLRGRGPSESPMAAASRAGTMMPAGGIAAAGAAASPGGFYAVAYYPASNQFGAPGPAALPADIVDAVADNRALPGSTTGES